MINEAWIRTKSQELEIPFSHVLSAYVTEMTLCILGQAKLGKELWLGSEEGLGLENYRKKDTDRLTYYYVGEEELLSAIEQVRQILLDGYKAQGFLVNRIWEEEKGNSRILRFSLSIKEMYVPFMIQVIPFHHHAFPREETMRLFLENNKTIQVLLYPMEQKAAEHLVQIMGQLELIQDMKCYLELYGILKDASLEGRKVWEHLELLCEKNHIKIDERTIRLLGSYRDYGYMKKKWKVLLRREKVNEPSWEEVHDLIMTFAEPVAKSLMEDQIFFGDWMPQLGRFFY